MHRIALLTSSRADYGVYLPLIRVLDSDDDIDLDIIAFGTHNAMAYGHTIDHIRRDGFEVAHTVDFLSAGDSARDIAVSMGRNMEAFAPIWQRGNYDLAICLGDRYEMFSAIAASVPFNVPVAHIAGGETTLGAIDNVFRHSLTLMSKLHFASTEVYAKRIAELTGQNEGVFNVGSLSIDNLKNISFLSHDEFKGAFGIDLSIPSILITFHPETVSPEKNKGYVDELVNALAEIQGFQFIITMPNADTMGQLVRATLQAFIQSNDNAVGVESFGMRGYLTCMKECAMMLGNTSSGFVEASFFPKPVINIGNRQNGRLITSNIMNIPIEKSSIVSAVEKMSHMQSPPHVSIYGNGNAASLIHHHIRNFLNGG